MGKKLNKNKKGHCKNCGQEIKIMIFKGEDYCCDLCRKALGKDVV